MKQKSRTEYSVMNTSVAFVAMGFGNSDGILYKSCFTRMLSEGYVGINGLFTDILNILSLSELGVERQSLMHCMPRSQKGILKTADSDADVPHLLSHDGTFCHGSRSVPDPVSEYSDERPPGRGSSGADLLSVSVKFRWYRIC